ncbi:hypothetical protein VNO77_03270 [Canavalia gladiata]|uniref:Uncharacterized protein n=1 Tax=Canavalia gladiata TaxID=3824 RepID=A0AAN9MZK4_CANGL
MGSPNTLRFLNHSTYALANRFSWSRAKHARRMNVSQWTSWSALVQHIHTGHFQELVTLNEYSRHDSLGIYKMLEEVRTTKCEIQARLYDSVPIRKICDDQKVVLLADVARLEGFAMSGGRLGNEKQRSCSYHPVFVSLLYPCTWNVSRK